MKDSKTETWLTQQKVPFEYLGSLRLSEIKINNEIKSNIRIASSIDEEVVTQYVEALKSGADFPPLMVVNGDPGVYELVNGLHRVEAFKRRNISKHDAYVLGIDDAVAIEKLRRTVNTIEGKRESMDSMVEHAIQLVNSGYTRADAAKMCNLPISKLTKRMRVESIADDLCKEMDVGKVNQLSETIIDSLGSVPRKKHRLKIAKLAHEARLPIQSVKEIVGDIKGVNSDKAAESVLREWGKRCEGDKARSGGGRVKPPSSPLRTLLPHLSRVNRIAGKVGPLRGFKDEERRIMAKQCRVSARLLLSMAKKLEASID